MTAKRAVQRYAMLFRECDVSTLLIREVEQESFQRKSGKHLNSCQGRKQSEGKL